MKQRDLEHPILQKLITIIEEVSGFPLNHKTIKRKREFVMARAIYYKIAVRYVGSVTYAIIGAQVGRDHAAVCHGLKLLNNSHVFTKSWQNIHGACVELLLKEYPLEGRTYIYRQEDKVLEDKILKQKVEIFEQKKKIEFLEEKNRKMRMRIKELGGYKNGRYY